MMVRRFREVLRHAALAPGLSVLDLGCGWAFGTHWARLSGCAVSGVDLAFDQLQWARASLPDAERLRLVQANAKRLPFRSASFDRVVSVEMMEHVYRPDRDSVVEEIARVLKPGGQVSISTPNPSSPIEAAKRLAVAVPAIRRRLPSACFPEASDDLSAYHPYSYHHPLPGAELAARLARAGIGIEGMRSFLWLVKTLPDALLGAARVAEAAAEAVPFVRRFGATTLVWGTRR